MDSGIITPPAALGGGMVRDADAKHAEKLAMGPGETAKNETMPHPRAGMLVAMLIGIAAGLGFLTIGLLGVFLIARVALRGTAA